MSDITIIEEFTSMIADAKKAEVVCTENKKLHATMISDVKKARERTFAELNDKVKQIDKDFDESIKPIQDAIRENHRIAGRINYPSIEVREGIVAAGFDEDNADFVIAYHGSMRPESIIDSRKPHGALSVVTIMHIANYGYVKYYTSEYRGSLDHMVAQYIMADMGAIYHGNGDPAMLDSDEGKEFIADNFNEMSSCMFAKV